MILHRTRHPGAAPKLSWWVVERGRSAGFTLIEVLASLSIFTVAVLGLAVGSTSVIRANQTALYHSIATDLAQDKLEELKGNTATTIVAGGPVTSVVPGVPVAFTRSWTFTSPCTVAGSAVANLRCINVTVTWSDYQANTLTISSAVKDS